MSRNGFNNFRPGLEILDKFHEMLPLLRCIFYFYFCSVRVGDKGMPPCLNKADLQNNMLFIMVSYEDCF